MLPPNVHPELHAAYQPQTLACILACIVLAEHRLGSEAPVFWDVAETLDRLSGHALMAEDDLPSSLASSAHRGWIRPTISCDLPAQTGGTRIPASLRHLVLHEGILMSRQTNDIQMAVRDAEDAGVDFTQWSGPYFDQSGGTGMSSRA